MYFLPIYEKPNKINYINVFSLQDSKNVENSESEVILGNEFHKFHDLCVAYAEKIEIYI